MAVGLDSGDQEDEHSCFSDTTHQDFVYDLKGVENVWTGEYPGATGPGVRDLVARVDPGVAAEVDRELADATAKIAVLGDPWDQVLASPPGSPERVEAEAAVSALGTLAQGFKRAGGEARRCWCKFRRVRVQRSAMQRALSVFFSLGLGRRRLGSRRRRRRSA